MEPPDWLLKNYYSLIFMNYNTIKITTTQAEAILLKLFNIEGVAKELPGELDFNFRIKVDGN